ncbi:hypothetical protein [Phocaeicola faecalis]
MELIRKKESITRVYENGEANNTVNDIQYIILDGDAYVGTASIVPTGFSMTVGMKGSIEDTENMLRNMLSSIPKEGGTK